MHIAKNINFYRWRNVRLAFGLLLVVLGGQTFASAQENPAPTSRQELTVSDLLKFPGVVIGEGSNTKAVGAHKVAKFRVEQVALPQTTEVEIGDRKVEVDHAFRLTIVGGPFPVRALPPVVWVDDVAVGFGVENEDLTEITVVTFDRALLKEGARLYLSYGDKENKKDRTELPEKLTLTGGAKGGRQ